MNYNSNYFDRYKLEFISEHLGILIAVVGFIIIGGWLFNIEVFKSLTPDFKPISPISAFYFVLIGISLFLLQNKRLNKLNIKITRLLMLIVALTSFLIIIEYIFNVNLGVNRILVNYPLEDINLGIMAFNTALNFLLTSFAILTLDKRINKGKYPIHHIILIVALITLFAIAGHIYGASKLYQLYFYTSMSVYTTILFSLVVLAVMFVRPNTGPMRILTSDKLGSVFARRMLPAVIFIPLLLGLLALLGQKAGFYNEAYTLAIVVISTTVLLAALVWNSMKSTNNVDIKRLKAKENLETTMKDLKRSNEELQQFAYVASHDLQEPLRTISNFTQLLERRYKDQLDEDADEFIEYVVDGTERMQLMIKELLQYSRVEMKYKNFKQVYIQNTVNEAIINLRASIEANNAEITHDRLPTIFADEKQLVQLFQNLIGNAIKFHKKEELPKIHISAEEDGDKYIFSVQDNGIGMKTEYKDHIFELFKRLNAQDEYNGTGIGLAVTKKIVERHGGHIWVESKLGKGSIFYFTIPFNQTNLPKS